MRRRAKASIQTLKINGQHIGARDDETILQLAQENGINIPTLCHLEGLEDIGACRLCLVEIKGQNKLQSACMTYAREGMEVLTNTERLKSHRKMVLSMLFAERNHVCSVCVSNGHCDLQDLAIEVGMTHVEVPYLYPNLPIDASHKRFVVDHNRCVLCTRCVRVCDEIEGAHTWDIMGRGHKSRVITDLNGEWGDSESCTSCGKCVQVCPTGALFEKGKAVAEMTKRREFLPYLRSLQEE
jgi:bidirectional [NiFe] hydrogenase diaphorase subunit